MKSVFILLDKDPYYPILGVFTSLEKAKAVWATLDRKEDVSIYEEQLDEAGQTIEPTYHG